MASGIKLTIVLPTQHRISVKIASRETLIRQVLEDACSRKNLEPDRHQLRRNNKVLDNSLSVRYADIPNLAELELVEIDASALTQGAERPIKLAIQPEGGERIISEFLPQTKLLDILSSIESEGQSEKQKLCGKIPVVVYMRKEISGNELNQTTLKGLGLKGGMSAALRFFYKPPDAVKEQANIFIPAPQSTSTEEITHRPMRKNNEVTLSDILPQKTNSGVSALPDSSEANDESIDINNKPTTAKADGSKDEPPVPLSKSQNKLLPETSSYSLKATTSQEIQLTAPESDVVEPEVLHYIDSLISETSPIKRNAIAFRIGESVSIKNIADISDDFFELNIKDIKLLHAQNVKKAKEIEEGAQLLTQQLRDSQAEGQKLSMMNRYKRCIIRIQFPPPDSLVLQGTFTVTESIKDVVKFVRNFLQDENIAFHLFTTPPKTVLRNDASLVDENCLPTALLHFGCSKEESASLKGSNQLKYLKMEVLPLLSNGPGVERAITESDIKKDKNDNSRDKTIKSDTSLTTNATYSTSSTEMSSGKSNNGTGVKRSGSNGHNQEANPDKKIPKWFKPGKPNPK